MRSSYFDLISGEREPQQTKGLGLLLAKSNLATKAFLAIPKIQAKLPPTFKKGEYTLSVCCELMGKDENDINSRIDIYIEFYKGTNLELIFVIEVKSINKETSFADTESQLDRYLNNKNFINYDKITPDRVIGIILTKHEHRSSSKHISLTWTDIIEAIETIKEKDPFADDYYNFLTNIRGTMKYYDREVLSIPTGEVTQTAIKEFSIYECPNNGRYQLKYKPLYLTFRKSNGGEMDALYKVEELIILNFKTDLQAFSEDKEYQKKRYVERVKNFHDYMIDKKRWTLDSPDYNEEKQVFILSDKTIPLDKKPKPERNNSYRCYYEIADLVRGVVP